MSAKQQYRIVASIGESAMTVFVDAADEAGALKFFAQAFPRHQVVSVKLEPVSPCAQYERKAGT